MTSSRFDILFEPVAIGPVTAPNRFYQVPHCTGMGRSNSRAVAAMRGIKAEGGWGVVCTEYCSIHPTSDDEAYPSQTLWDDNDIRANALMTDAVHAHGALAGVELWIGGSSVPNLSSRLLPFSLSGRPVTQSYENNPIQPRKLDRRDIRNVLKWQYDAAKRAVEAGFDIVYVYATHGYLISEFLDPSNQRNDEYGGSLENRTRIVTELIDVTRQAVGDKCAIATRFSADLENPESYDAFSILAELPDLWDLVVDDYGVEMGVSRFVQESSLTQSVAKAKRLTSKPVVAVGRFTSPDTMLDVIKTGVQDFIGAARPSIADPFLPNKIKHGNVEDIRECIGCNVCYAHNSLRVPIRCTQNPTMGEEWRRGWHPENVQADKGVSSVLVVGAGPAGLEASRVLGDRGYQVMLADSRREAGGRVSLESRLPGLNQWTRVRDWRLTQISKLESVELYLQSTMTVDDIVELAPDNVIIATGSSWTIDGIGRHRKTAIAISAESTVLKVDDLIDGGSVEDRRVVIYDDDHYYMGPVLALMLCNKGNDVTIVTPSGRLCSWGEFTGEQYPSIELLMKAGVTIITNSIVEKVIEGELTYCCIFSGRETTIDADAFLPVTARTPADGLYETLLSRQDDCSSIVQRCGDCEAPGTIAAAVYGGYRLAIEMDMSLKPVLRDLPMAGNDVTRESF